MVRLAKSISEAMKEMGFQSPEERQAEEIREMERIVNLRNMSDKELECGVKFSTGIEGYAARSEKERRSSSRGWRGLLSRVAIFAPGIFFMGWFIWECVKIYLEQGL